MRALWLTAPCLFALVVGATSLDGGARAAPLGVPMIISPDHGFPLVHLNLYFGVGAAHDPPGREGLTSLTTRALLAGTRHHGRAALEEAVEDLGAELLPFNPGFAAGLGGSVLTRNLPGYTALLTEILTEPAFAAEEIERIKRKMIAELESVVDDDGALARRWFWRLSLAGATPAGPTQATPRSLAAITPAEVRAHFARYFVRANLLVGAAGDVEEPALRALLDPLWTGLPAGEAARWATPTTTGPRGRRVALIDKADRSQAQILIGHMGVPPNHPDSYALNVAMTAFGGTFTSRLMQAVRVDRGLSYGAYARLTSSKVAPLFYMDAAPEADKAAQTARLMIDEYARLIDEGLSDAEVARARDYVISAFPFSVETAALRSAQRVRARLLGRADDFLETYTARVGQLTPDEVRAAARRHLNSQDLLIVVVCTAPPLRDAFAALPGVTEVRLHPASLWDAPR